ncbi:16S rRNA (guanine(527)-N(7))-methyltransferase RsmG [Lachnospiraceae bacterium OttesenSCG-928-E19]|nr:16S rRNA (guanine(527)-N(7))-methyltransferase RsmG [Lachnospiraceae bacterium OttesenSCG-928-E19]
MNNKAKFNKYADMLRDWQTRMNLVARGTLDDIETRHFADSAQLADILPTNVRIVDLGSGAGFPSAVLAIMGWDVTAIESIGKKASFLSALKTELNLPNFTVYHGRVEDYVKKIKRNDLSVVFTARAFASLTKILDYVGRTKSRLFLLKGREVESEIADAQTKYKFDYQLIPSKTGDGYILIVENIQKK